MKKILLTLFLVFFSGCSSKVELPAGPPHDPTGKATILNEGAADQDDPKSDEEAETPSRISCTNFSKGNLNIEKVRKSLDDYFITTMFGENLEGSIELAEQISGSDTSLHLVLYGSQECENPIFEFRLHTTGSHELANVGLVPHSAFASHLMNDKHVCGISDWKRGAEKILNSPSQCGLKAPPSAQKIYLPDYSRYLTEKNENYLFDLIFDVLVRTGYL